MEDYVNFYNIPVEARKNANRWAERKPEFQACGS